MKLKLKPLKPRRVQVIWRDAEGLRLRGNWHAWDEIAEQAPTDCLCHTLAWLIGEDERFVYLSGEQFPVGQTARFGQCGRIPRGCVVSLRKVKPGKKIKI